jgi:1-acyl-sn-glycerol-3-phosphate acyltransferase
MTSDWGAEGAKEQAVQCAGVTARGARCKKPALPGYSFCRLHMPFEGQQQRQQQSFGGQSAQPDMEQVVLLLQQILEAVVCLQAQNETPDQKQLRQELNAKILAFLNDKLELIKRRVDGDYDVDRWGRDDELVQACRPILDFLYKKYWRVTVSGVENVPSEGRALLVANHSGVVPWDAVMIMHAVQVEHNKPRWVRGLHLSWASELPMVGLALARLGQVQALPENALRLLQEDELALVFPEGVKGIGKPFSERYQLARFGRGGFVRTALKAKAPIVPVSVVGAEEIHPLLSNVRPIASMFKMPYVPITPTFPWLGPLGLIPLPTKWHIHFDKAIPLQDMEHGPSGEPLLVSKIAGQVREIIQSNIYEILKKRRAVFW